MIDTYRPSRFNREFLFFICFRSASGLLPKKARAVAKTPLLVGPRSSRCNVAVKFRLCHPNVVETPQPGLRLFLAWESRSMKHSDLWYMRHRSRNKEQRLIW